MPPCNVRGELDFDALVATASSLVGGGPDLVLYFKHRMVLEGHAIYTHQLNPTDAPPPQRVSQRPVATVSSLVGIVARNLRK